MSEDTFIPGIWTHSTAVPVAFDRNSAKVSSAIDKRLEKIQASIYNPQIHTTKWSQSTMKEKDPTTITPLTLQD